MGSVFSGLGWPVLSAGTVLAQLDISGYLVGDEFLAVMASLFGALFAGLANALISAWFGSAG